MSKIIHGMLLLILVGVCPVLALSDEKLPMKFSGDFRYRHDRARKERAAIRSRHVLRARFGFLTAISQNLKVEMRLNTMTTVPNVANATLDEHFAGKEVRLDLANFRYSFYDYFNVGGGKVKNPFLTVGKSELIWDQDITPEGLYVSYKYGSESLGIHINTGGFWVDERDTAEDSMLYAFQLAPEFQIGFLKVLLGGGVYNFDHSKGRAPFVNSSSGMGNSTAHNAYVYSYNLMNGFIQLDSEIFEYPITLYFDYVYNEDPPLTNTGWLGGISLGSSKKEGQWKAGYSFRYVEKDATVGAFTDADFKGGGTDGSGHKFTVDYAATNNVSFGLTQFISKTAILNGLNYTRTFLDMSIKF